MTPWWSAPARRTRARPWRSARSATWSSESWNGARSAQTFRDWPRAQRFLTPSFTTNGFGTVDLNAIHPATSPAHSLGNDYLNGPEFARYLELVARHFNVPLLTSVEVLAVSKQGDLLHVVTDAGTVPSRSVVWAGGEFHEPLLEGFTGAALTDHSSTAAAWAPRHGEVVVNRRL